FRAELVYRRDGTRETTALIGRTPTRDQLTCRTGGKDERPARYHRRRRRRGLRGRKCFWPRGGLRLPAASGERSEAGGGQGSRSVPHRRPLLAGLAGG